MILTCDVNENQTVTVLGHRDLRISETAVSLPWLIQPLFHKTRSEIKTFSRISVSSEDMLHCLEHRNALQDGRQLVFTNREQCNVSEKRHLDAVITHGFVCVRLCSCDAKIEV